MYIYPRDWHNSIAKPPHVITPNGSQISLGTIASIKVSDGPSILKSENARPPWFKLMCATTIGLDGNAEYCWR